MRIAVATNDGKTISMHFGRASAYLVFTVEEGKIIEKERREKPGHQQFAHEQHDDHSHEHGHGLGTHSASKHNLMIEPIRDCAVVIVRGMGTGAYNAMEQAQIRPFVTEIEAAEDAVLAYINGALIDHPEWLH
jgi:predicted Fe-Mo cluster-binding NifX family protein